jgi:choline dehydrogenase-like flavoprotein
MLMDGRSVASGTSLKARTCIVGTGMGALSVARLLVQAGTDVLLIEAGPVTASAHKTPAIEMDEVGRSFRIASSRGLELGGGTAFWHGMCAPLDESDFQQRDWIPHSGWPIRLADLTSHYRAAWNFLCGGDRTDLGRTIEQRTPQLAAADILENKVYQFRTPPFRGKALLLKWCKQHLVRCVTNTVALELEVKDGTAHHLIVGSGNGTFTVQADTFIIAAGALETPRLLLNSHARSTSGLGDAAWWLGRNLIDHPAAYLSQVVFHEPVAARRFSGSPVNSEVNALPGFMIKPEAQRTHELPNHALFIRPGLNEKKLPNLELMSFLGLRSIRDFRSTHLKAMLVHRYIRWRVFNQRLKLNRRTRYGDLFFMTEQLPNPVSRVDLSESKRDRFGYPVARINWQLNSDDVDSFKKTHDLIMESLDRQATISASRKDDISDWLGSVSSAAHHLGTARMAHSPGTGVVDTNLKVFSFNNVWICDGSVFPTAGSANPSLTICALGHRLGSHLLGHGEGLVT